MQHVDVRKMNSISRFGFLFLICMAFVLSGCAQFTRDLWQSQMNSYLHMENVKGIDYQSNIIVVEYSNCAAYIPPIKKNFGLHLNEIPKQLRYESPASDVKDADCILITTPKTQYEYARNYQFPSDSEHTAKMARKSPAYSLGNGLIRNPKYPFYGGGPVSVIPYGGKEGDTHGKYLLLPSYYKRSPANRIGYGALAVIATPVTIAADILIFPLQIIAVTQMKD